MTATEAGKWMQSQARRVGGVKRRSGSWATTQQKLSPVVWCRPEAMPLAANGDEVVACRERASGEGRVACMLKAQGVRPRQRRGRRGPGPAAVVVELVLGIVIE